MPACPNCGNEVRASDRFCSSCAAPLTAAHAGVSGTADASPAEPSRQVPADHSDAGVRRRVMARYFNDNRPVVKPHGGREPGAGTASASPATRARTGEWWYRELRLDEETRVPDRDLLLNRPSPPLPPPPGPAAAEVTTYRPPPAPPPALARPPVVIVSSSPPPPAAATQPASPPAPARASSAAPAPVPPLDLPGLARRLRDSHVAALGIAAALLAAAALVLAPGDDRVAPGAVSRPPPVATLPPSPIRAGAGSPRPRAGSASPSTGPSSPTTTQGSKPSSSCDAACNHALGLRLVGAINGARRSNGRGPLTMDAQLTTVAEGHVADMIRRRKLFHTKTDVLGAEVKNWRRVLAESIGVGPSVQALLEALLRSQADRRNVLDRAFNHIGVGAIQKGRRLWMTVLFSDGKSPPSGT